MPRDDLGYIAEDQEEEERKSGGSLGSRRRFDEYDCPACSANNPVPDGFGNREELICNYCGVEFVAVVDDDGRLKLKET